MKILGIEFGSTVIKSILINEKGETLSSVSYVWENELIEGLWSYSLEIAKAENFMKNYKKYLVIERRATEQ